MLSVHVVSFCSFRADVKFELLVDTLSVISKQH